MTTPTRDMVERALAVCANRRAFLDRMCAEHEQWLDRTAEQQMLASAANDKAGVETARAAYDAFEHALEGFMRDRLIVLRAETRLRRRLKECQLQEAHATVARLRVELGEHER